MPMPLGSVPPDLGWGLGPSLLSSGDSSLVRFGISSLAVLFSEAEPAFSMPGNGARFSSALLVSFYMVPVAPWDDTDHSHQHIPKLELDHGLRHGNWQQPGLDVTMALGVSACLSVWHSPSSSMALQHHCGPRPQCFLTIEDNRNLGHQHRPWLQ